MHQHMADARLDFYHRTAHTLLNEFDAVGVGKWRGKGKAAGKGKAKRAQNRKDYDHAISLFTGTLKYKSANTPKCAEDIIEHGSTRDCGGCGEPTGPSGLADLRIRQWVCSNCQKVNHRDFTAAQAIAQRTAKKVAAEAHLRASAQQAKYKRRRFPADQTKVARVASA